MIDARSRGGYTALMLAAMYNRISVYYHLLNTGKCDKDLRDYSGRTAEQYLEKKSPSIIEEEDYEDKVDDGGLGEENDGKRKRMKKKVERGSSLLRDLATRASMRHKIHGESEMT